MKKKIADREEEKMTISKLREDSRNRSYSDRVNFTPKGWTIFKEVASYLGSLKRFDYHKIDGLVKSQQPSLLSRINDLKTRFDLQDVYAKAICNDNDFLLALSWRNLKSNRREWHKDIKFAKKNKSKKSVARAVRAQTMLDSTLNGPRVCIGGRKLWLESQQNDNKMQEFKYKRWFLGSAGRSSYLNKDGKLKTYGTNQMIRLDQDGNLSIIIPRGLWSKFEIKQSTCRVIIGSVKFNHGQEIINQAILDDRSITYHIQFINGHWKLRAQTQLPLASNGAKNKKRAVGIDLNSGHIDAWIIDEFGNPIGSPITFKFSKRTVNQAVNKVLKFASMHQARTIVVENLKGLQRANTRSRKGRLNKVVTEIPTGQFKSYMESKTQDLGFDLLKVNPAYTSQKTVQWNDVLWKAKSNHQKASYLIGRRGIGLNIDRVKRKDSGLSDGFSIDTTQSLNENTALSQELLPARE